MHATTVHTSTPGFDDPNELLTNHVAAKIIGVTAHTLDVWRITNRYGLPYIRVGRKIRYRRSDLVAWLESRRVG
jgi:hypothetical protein